MGWLECLRQHILYRGLPNALGLYGAKNPLNWNLCLGKGENNIEMTTCVRHTHTNIQEQATGLWPENPKCSCGTAHVQVKCGCVETLLVDIAGLHCLRRGTIQINTSQKEKAKNCFCCLPVTENHGESKSCAKCARARY